MNIKAFGITIVAYILLTSVISMLAPKGKMENSIKFVVSLGFVFVVASNIFNLKIEMPQINYEENTNSSETNFYDVSLDFTISILESRIKTELTNENIKLDFLQINADISQDNGIIIDSIVYDVKNSEQIILIENTIEEVTGCKNIMRKSNEEYITQ